MQPFVDPHLFNAHALPVDVTEPHAQVGNHLRVDTHPMLGLPVAPFVVHRAEVDNLKLLNVRTAVVFSDRFGDPLVPPFDVTPENPVVARLERAAGEVCLWAQVLAISKADLEGTSEDRRGPYRRTDPFRKRDPIRKVDPFRKVGPIRKRDPIRKPWPRPGGGLRPVPAPPVPAPSEGALVCEAFINAPRGPASIGTRSKRRWAFSGPGIVEIHIRGEGRVSGVHWVEASDRQHLDFQPYAVVNLPHESGPRYLSVADPIAAAEARVDAQAPKRRPLQETVDAPAPGAAPLSSVGQERDRVQSLLPTLADDLDVLIDDVSQHPFDHRVVESLVNENGDHVGSASMARLHRVMQARTDPGTASFLGYKLRDDRYQEVEDRVVFYRIDGFFRALTPPKREDGRDLTPAEQLLGGMLQAVPQGSRNWDREELHQVLRKALSGVPDGNVPRAERLQDVNDYFAAGTMAVADRGAPLDPVPPPQITGTEHRSWLPDVPPAATREVVVDCAGVRVAGLLAAGKRTPAAGPSAYAPLNKENAQGFHLPLVLSLQSSDGTGEPVSEPGTGFIADRDAGPSAIRYFLAQQDRFGRFSAWTARSADAGPRPKPPRPEFQAFYTQPSIPDAATRGGTVLVKVMVPDRDTLAPGSHPLARLRLTVVDQTLGTTTTMEEPEGSKTTLPAGDPATYFLYLKWEGPVLQPTEVRRLRLTAEWIDTADAASVPSEPQTLKLHDPRPPAQVPVPDVLQYAARPDVTGLSWVEHRWTPSAGQASFGIYYTDENRLQAWLESEGRSDVLASIEGAPDAAARATVYRTHGALFPDHLFERLRDVTVDFASGQQGFRHPVSGSLRLLSFYKIAAEAASGARPLLGDLEMIVYGVPNSDPPARPVLQVEPVAAGAGENPFVAQVTISLLGGTTRGQMWRLRRSAVESGTIARMPVVTTGTMGAPDDETGLQTAVHRDDGPLVIAETAELRPWARYSWVAEGQGAPESGSVAAGRPVPGRWSSPSDPVSLILVPEGAPAPVTVEEITGTATPDGLADVALTVSHPDELTGGPIGAFTLRLARRPAPGSPLTMLREQDVYGAGPHEVSGLAADDAGEVVPVGAEYVVELVDPVGRVSPRATAVVT